MIAGVAIAYKGTLGSTIYHSNLRNLDKLDDCGRESNHNNHKNLVTTGASATFVTNANIVITVTLVNLAAKSNLSEEDKHGNQKVEQLQEAMVRVVIMAAIPGNVR
jgi:hypothetical protein